MGAADHPLAPAAGDGLGPGPAPSGSSTRSCGCTCLDLDPEAGSGADPGALAAELEAELVAAAAAGEATSGQACRRARGRAAPRWPPRGPAGPPGPSAGARAAAAREADRPPYRLVPGTPGSLDGLRLEPCARRAPGPGEVEIAVEATGLNFKDVLNVLGMYPGDPGPLGGECAGAVIAVGAGVTHVARRATRCSPWPAAASPRTSSRAPSWSPGVPPGVGAEEGAAFPIAYLTAEFCLGHLAGLRAGERVLIHAAAGGVGMAAVRLAQRAGAEVFATAGSPAKRALLRELGVAHVLDSRSTAFADEVLAATGGRGVDVVLNSLSGELIDASFRALARGGRFVEIGKRGIKDPAWVAALGRGLRYTWSTGARRRRGSRTSSAACWRAWSASSARAPSPRCRATSSRSTRRRAPSASWRRRATSARSSCATGRRQRR